MWLRLQAAGSGRLKVKALDVYPLYMYSLLPSSPAQATYQPWKTGASSSAPRAPHPSYSSWRSRMSPPATLHCPRSQQGLQDVQQGNISASKSTPTPTVHPHAHGSTSTCTPISTFTSSQTFTCTYTPTFTSTYSYIHMHAYTYLYLPVYIRTFVRTYMHTCICIYAYMHTCMHTRRHT